VKPTNPEQRDTGVMLDCGAGTGFRAKNVSLRGLINWAYDWAYDSDPQIDGGPNWINSQATTFEIEGKAAGRVSFAECQLMVQSLLADRFKLVTHRETREVPVYLLSIGAKGPKIHTVEDDSRLLSTVFINGGGIQLRNGYATTASGRGMSMPELARFLARLPAVGRPVLDKTGLTGFYGFHLDFAYVPGNDERPDIFTAVREQLGLKLEPAKSALEILVVDHAERPSEN
jgi:uncharacterized protein (TIGR03435 family)